MEGSRIMSYLKTNEELIALRKKWKELGIEEPFPPFNYDEYAGITDYIDKIREQLKSFEGENC